MRSHFLTFLQNVHAMDAASARFVFSNVPTAYSTQLTCRLPNHSVRRRAEPAWRKLLRSPDFRAIAAVNAIIFTTNNGGRSVLMPLLAKEHLAMKTSTLGAPLAPAAF